ncbi:hypothetical protein KJ693_09055, partial [bacterium]|nr:hypothetical protein [bacterium]
PKKRNKRERIIGLGRRFGHFGRVGIAHRFLRIPLLVGIAHPTSTPPEFVSGRNDDHRRISL